MGMCYFFSFIALNVLSRSLRGCASLSQAASASLARFLPGSLSEAAALAAAKVATLLVGKQMDFKYVVDNVVGERGVRLSGCERACVGLQPQVVTSCTTSCKPTHAQLLPAITQFSCWFCWIQWLIHCNEAGSFTSSEASHDVKLRVRIVELCVFVVQAFAYGTRVASRSYSIPS